MTTRKVYLEGEMGYKFGKEFNIAAESFADVFRCLKCNFDTFMPYLQECHEKNIGFILEVQGKPLKDEVEMLLLYKEGDMVITPVPAGSKSGFGKIVAAIAITVMTAGMGAVIMGAGAGAAGSSAALAATFGSFSGFTGTLAGMMSAGGGLTALAQVGLGLGINLAIGGIQQMMAPDPSTDNQQDESYIFQGAKQNLVEGDPVPILYGELRIPGRTVSFHTRSERTAFYNYNSRATSSEDNGEEYAQQRQATTGGSAGGASQPNGGDGTVDFDFAQRQLEAGLGE